MTITDKTTITGLHNDRRANIFLNALQQDELQKYFRRVETGRYRLAVHQYCPLCECDRVTLVAQKDRYGIPQHTVVCDECGVIFTLDPLDTSSLETFYREQYRKLYDGHEAQSAFKENYHDQRFHERSQLAKSLLDQVGELVELPDQGTVVEIGAGGGWNLIGFPILSWKAIGYDYDIAEMMEGKKRGLDMRQGSAQQAVKDNTSADIVLMFQFLEHAANPVETLKDVASILKPGGVVYIGVPGLRTMIIGGWGDKLIGTLQNAHLFLFELATLDFACRKAGLKRLWGVEGISAVYALDHSRKTTRETTTMREGPAVIDFIGLLEKTALFWGAVWALCGGPGSRASIFARRIATSAARRMGFNY